MNGKKLVDELAKGREVVVVPSRRDENFNSAIFYMNATRRIWVWSRELGNTEWSKGEAALAEHFNEMAWKDYYLFARGYPKKL